MSTFRQVQKLAEFYDAKGKADQPITVIGTRAHLRKEFKAAERGGGAHVRHPRTALGQAGAERLPADNGLGGRVSTVPNKWEEGIQSALQALYAPPMTEAELAHYNSLRAAEMARAEARRQPSPQLDLEG